MTGQAPTQDGTPVTSTETGAIGKVDLNFGEPQGTPEVKLPEFVVPEKFKGKEWVSNVAKSASPYEELFNQIENLQGVIGRKSEGLQVPGDDATPEQQQAWRVAIGVPDTSESYTYIPPSVEAEEDKSALEYLKQTRDEEWMGELKKAAHEAGITPKQFQKFIEKNDTVFINKFKGQVAASKSELEAKKAQFDSIVNKMIGENRDAVLKANSDLLKEVTPAEAHPLWEKLDPEQRALVAVFINGFKQRYIKPDSFSPSAGSGGTPLTKAAIEAEGIRLMQDPAWSRADHPQHDEVRRKVKENYARLKDLP